MSIDFNAPKDKRALGAVLSVPNLLLTTLAVVVPVLLPRGAARATDSAPSIKAQVFNLATARPLTLGIPGPANTIPLPLGLPLQLISAPQLKLEISGYMGGSVLGPPPSVPVQSIDTSRLQPKYQINVEQPPRPLTLGSVAPPLPSIATVRWDWSAPYPKYQVQVDAYPNALASIPPAPPNPVTVSSSAPITKHQVIAENRGSQLTSGYPPPPVAIPLPLGYPVDQFQYQAKYSVTFTPNPNLLVLGYPVPVVVTGLPHDVGFLVNIGFLGLRR